MTLTEIGLVVHKKMPTDQLKKTVIEYLKNHNFKIKSVTDDPKETLILTVYNQRPDNEIRIRIKQTPQAIVTYYTYLQYHEPIEYDESEEYHLLIELLKKLCTIGEPLFATDGVMDFWPPLENIIQQITKTKIPVTEDERYKRPIYGTFLFLSNEFLEKYPLDQNKIKKLNPKKTQKGLVIDWHNKTLLQTYDQIKILDRQLMHNSTKK